MKSASSAKTRYFKFLTGRRCYLSPMNPEDAPVYTEWLNDLTIMSNLMMTPHAITLNAEKEMVEKMTKDQQQHQFAIVDLKTDRLIGGCGLRGVDTTNGKADFGIFIGDKSFWNRGFGTEATMLILDYGFNILHLRNIILGVFSFNERAIACYRKCGFKLIGRRRKAKKMAGKVYDEVLMDILSEEYKSVFVKPFLEKTVLKA